MATERLFDRFVMVDWSAASQPTRGEDSIWRASYDVLSGTRQCINHPTRADAFRSIRAELVAAPDRRVLLGFDFALGYPEGFAARMFKPGSSWRAVWGAISEEIVDDDDNGNNRFPAAARLSERAGMSPGPFWGCPADRAVGALRATKPATFMGLPEFRLAERRLREGGRRPFSVWQLFGAGAVGSQTLLGIPVVRRLAEDPALSKRFRIWPFETGCDPYPTRSGAGSIIVAEVWPSMFEFVAVPNQVRDAAQVTAVCEQLGEIDRAGRLGELFAPSLTLEQSSVVEREEGWILGA
jgi:precorrin-8X/cobalt-precorrin-8 methylmutase